MLHGYLSGLRCRQVGISRKERSWNGVGSVRQINNYEALKSAITLYLKEPSGHIRSGRGRALKNQRTRDLLVVLSKATGNSTFSNWRQQLSEHQRAELCGMIRSTQLNPVKSQMLNVLNNNLQQKANNLVIEIAVDTAGKGMEASAQNAIRQAGIDRNFNRLSERLNNLGTLL